MRDGFVELNRRFMRVSPYKDPEMSAFANYLSGLEPGNGWNEVLASRCAVILGEAGSGKSWELEAQAEQLRANGEAAFFVRLEFLVQRPLKKALDHADIPAFRKWLKARHQATFFLDSVDEARLTGRHAFHAALQNLALDLLPALHRARVVVSCRVSEWHWELDTYELRKQLRLIDKPTFENKMGQEQMKMPDTIGPMLDVYSIIRLDRLRVRLLAKKQGVKDVTGFEEAIDAADAWNYIGRPGDVADFAQYWISRGQLGSLTDILEFTIGKRLRETTERDDSLSPKDCREAVEELAAAATFCRSFTFRT